ncbi:hypothetical protein DVZ67_18615 [Salmonella enterica subsp. enterica serovar Saintpaul]|uniref:hypothetical protein n=1 Tax=Citrobacter braakii TaxID=57706 RepID=UPI001320815E|nr:hypothetical protein [Salmonella enterica subsp. enterica serovar Saintpaul]EDR0878036.1 hypothetical protein [Salmonella enterica]EHF7826082.1 hypothetical protein [Salmonella enterica]EHM6138552.1 hypothetical protein [Salmonella enterica]EHM6196205.1 hypothetical protein [Salmonella enterica]
MKSQKRAMRRHHTKRLKAKRNHYNNIGAGGMVALGIVYRTPCLCSCWMCGNQRQYHGMHIQERRASAMYFL